QKAAWYTLHTVLKTVLLLLAPITPHMTDHVWTALYSKKSIHSQRMPKKTGRKAKPKITDHIIAFNREVWKIKKEKNIALRDTLEAEIPKVLKPYRDDLAKMHSLIAKP
ncbi:MAG TPA: class I tRNA ligase family protein, partial [Candidatus Acidoferrum sp.]|nr:class I tRNA ligase family protein [Candidatus Acidoferrum sp.]